MVDIDIMVREERLLLAEETLLDLGYEIDESMHSRGWYMERSHQLAPFRKRNPCTEFDVHRSIVDTNGRIRANIDINNVWSRSVSTSLQGIPARVLSPEDTVIHLCLHHCMYLPFWGKIKNLLDLAMLLERKGEEIDWDLVLDVSRRGRFTRFLYYPLHAMDETFHTGLDRGVLRRLKKLSDASLMEDRFLKSILRRNLLVTDGRASLFPHWMLTRLTEDMLFHDTSGARWASVFRTLAMPTSPADCHGNTRPPTARDIVSFLGRRAGKLIRKRSASINAVHNVSEKSGASPAG
jgi:hypothetical protein